MQRQNISCFMNVRNVLSQGYPFVESIISALPICDEFVVSDGYSDDGTFEILERLAELYPKIKLVKIKWKINEKTKRNGKILADTANETLRFCKGKYIFYHQACEVIHEDSVNKIRQLVFNHPNITFFHLPYWNFVRDMVYIESFGLRLSKNMYGVYAVGDAANLSFSRNTTIKNILNGIIRHPFKLKETLSHIYSSYGFVYGPYMHSILPKPIFRYTGLLFKEDLIQKAEQHKKLLIYNGISYDRYDEILISLKKNINSEHFWKIWFGYIYNNSSGAPVYFRTPLKTDLSEHPKIVQGLLKSRKTRYFVRKKLLEDILV